MKRFEKVVVLVMVTVGLIVFIAIMALVLKAVIYFLMA